jgi:hypothetical protein
MNGPAHRYSVYGVAVTSDCPLPLPPVDECQRAVAAVEFVAATERDFSDVVRPPADAVQRFESRVLDDGSTYVRWSGLYEFRVRADGSRVACRPLNGSDLSVLQNFLVAPALSFALVQQGIEPLHASVVDVDGHAVGFLGDCTFGKSTLLAAFVQAGHRVLTDDLAIVERRNGCAVVLPGSGRIKLMPDSATALLGDRCAGAPLNPYTVKAAFTVDSARVQRSALKLTQLFVLPTPAERDGAASFDAQPLSRIELARELLKNSFNVELVGRERLARQFAFVTHLAADLGGWRLKYPSGLHHLPEVRSSILEHCRRGVADDRAHANTLRGGMK